ncbi:hypothetical protein Droror1_Dr00014460 [Drosera rotundifolia]
MEVLFKVGISVACIVAITWAWRLLEWVWLRPKALEKQLRQQGLSGNPYRLLYGDVNDRTTMALQAMSKPIDFTNNYVHRVMPFRYQTIKKHGNHAFMWNGPTPVVFITEPELIREVFNKYRDYQKPKGNPLGQLLAPGFIQFEGDKWAQHRKLMNPAFHVEKLKVTMILHEVLRLYSPVTELQRKTDHDIQLGDLLLPAGIIVDAPIILAHYNPKFWGEDVKEFNPERFSDGISKATNGNNSFFPFGWGPRICIGQNFALAEAKLALTMILQRFAFRLSPSYVHAPVMALLLVPQHGIQLILERI